MLHPSLACFLVCRPGWSLSLWFSQPVGKGYRLSLWGQLYTAPPRSPSRHLPVRTMVPVSIYRGLCWLCGSTEGQSLQGSEIPLKKFCLLAQLPLLTQNDPALPSLGFSMTGALSRSLPHGPCALKISCRLILKLNFDLSKNS